LTPDEQGKATAFMFGKVLWCLFECQPTINSTSFCGASIFKDMNSEPRFLHFRKTPVQMQRLIRECTEEDVFFAKMAPHKYGEYGWAAYKNIVPEFLDLLARGASQTQSKVV
jgi:hypothetical protein